MSSGIGRWARTTASRSDSRVLHVIGTEAALEWTIVAKDGDEWVVFDGVDVFTFDPGPLISSVRAYWEPDGRSRVRERP